MTTIQKTGPHLDFGSHTLAARAPPEILQLVCFPCQYVMAEAYGSTHSKKQQNAR